MKIRPQGVGLGHDSTVPHGGADGGGGSSSSNRPQNSADMKGMKEAVQEELVRLKALPFRLRVEHFSAWRFVKELVYNVLFPLTLPLIIAAEGGMDGIRRRELLTPIQGFTSLSGREMKLWVGMASYTMSLRIATWAVVYLALRDYESIKLADCTADAIYVTSVFLVHQASISRKWATWDAAAVHHFTSGFEAKRSQEMISAWLIYPSQVAVSLVVRAIQESRLDYVAPVKVLLLQADGGGSDGDDGDWRGHQHLNRGGEDIVGMMTTRHIQDMLLRQPQKQQPQQQEQDEVVVMNPALSSTGTKPYMVEAGSDSTDGGSHSNNNYHKNDQAPSAWASTTSYDFRQAEDAIDPLDHSRTDKVWVTDIFAELALQLGMTGYGRTRSMFKLLVSLFGAMLPSLIRYLTGTPPLGTTPTSHMVIILCAYIQLSVLNQFILPFMESSLVTFRRLMFLSRELVGLTTQDPGLLAYARVSTRTLPYFMPLCYNTNLIAWLRLRSAAMLLGHSFRTRITFFLTILLVRTGLGLVLLLSELMARHHVGGGEGRRVPAVLVGVLEYDVLIFTSGLLSMMVVATKISDLTDRQVLQLKRMRLESSFPMLKCHAHLLAADVADPATLGFAIDYLETDRQLRGLRLLGVPMTTRGILSILAGALPVMSGLYVSYLRSRHAI